jgi:ABC-type Mn2+/Zn2+ transport system permease subunit
VFAFLVMPAVGATLMGASEATRLVWGWVIAGVAGVLGLHLGFALDLPAAPVIVLTLGLLLLLAAIVGRLRGADG